MLSGQTELVPSEHSIEAHHQPIRPGLVVRISHADHAAVTEFVAVAYRLLSLTRALMAFSGQNFSFYPTTDCCDIREILLNDCMDVKLKNRLKGMVLGQFLGDAASLGVHWIYNTKDIESMYPKGFKGFEMPAQGHYHAGKLSGDLTHYGDASLVLMEALAEETAFHAASFGAAFVEKMDPSKGYKGYFDSATRGTLENFKNHLEVSSDPFGFQEGADDDQLATISSLAVFIAFYIVRNEDLPEDCSEILQQVETLTRVRQNNNRAIAYCKTHTRLLLELLAGRDIHSAFHHVEEQLATNATLDLEVRRKLKEAFDLKHKSTVEATDILGQSCPLICSFPSAVQAIAKHNEDFKKAILETVQAGGDNAGRAALIGSWVGARLGADALPNEWIGRLNQSPRILAILENWGL